MNKYQEDFLCELIKLIERPELHNAHVLEYRRAYFYWTIPIRNTPVFNTVYS